MSENVPPLPNPEQPPLAPYDPPEPAPQAAAWARALRVIFTEEAAQLSPVPTARCSRTQRRGGAAKVQPRRDAAINSR